MQVATEPLKSEKDFSAAFECLGVMLGEVPPNGNTKCDCVFCMKEGHFYLNVRTGQWDCKSCGKEGNVFTFLEMLCEHWYEHTSPQRWKSLGEARGIPPDAFKEWGCGYNQITDEWMIPVYNDKATVRQLRRWDGKKTFNVDGCGIHLFGLYALATATEKRKRRIWLCEGEWDAMALRWLLMQCGIDEIATAVPGASSFKGEWINWYKGCDVVYAFDNDKAGDDGSAKAAEFTKSVAKRQRFVCWPEMRPAGWDIRDQIKEGLVKQLPPAQILREIESLIEPQHRRTRIESEAKAAAADQEPAKPAATFPEVLAVFRKWVKMDRDFMDCLIVALTVSLSNEIPNEPLWFYIIGSPGTGKTLILSSLAKSERCVFESSFTPRSLMSGWSANPDPSLLPQFDGKTGVIKDGTTILALPYEMRVEASSILRDAFDGLVKRSYANGVVRRYDNLHFNMLIGVTQAVRADNTASMGERFLCIEMRQIVENVRAKMEQMVMNSMKGKVMTQELQDICTSFLTRRIVADELPLIPKGYIERIMAMAEFTVLLRASVTRDRYDRSLSYRPEIEDPGRVLSQLVKFSRVASVVLGKHEVDNDVCRLLRKIMADTCVGFHLDIVKALIRNQNGPMTMNELAVTCQIGTNTIQKRLEDMSVLGILRAERHLGKMPGDMAVTKYLLTDRIMNLWEESHGNKKNAVA